MFKIPPEKRGLAVVLSLVAIVASGVFLWRMFSGPDYRAQQKNFIAVGGFAAETLAERVPSEAQLLLIAPPAGVSEIMDRQLEAFRDELAVRGGQLVAQIEPPMDDRVEEAFFYDMGMSASAYVDLIRPYETVDYVVSFAGPPLAFEEDFEWPADLPQLVVVGSALYEMGEMLKAGVVAWAIGPQLDPVEPERPPKTPREWFDLNYVVYTAEDVDWLL